MAVQTQDERKKEMKPEKANRAIALTIVIAVLLELLCMSALFGWIPFNKDKGTTDADGGTESPAPTPPQAQETQQAPKPSAEDLKGCSDKLTYPKEESYLDQYESYSVQPSPGMKTYLLYKPEKLKYTSDRIMDLEKDTIVEALAKENGFTLVRIKPGLAGWVPTQELQAH